MTTVELRKFLINEKYLKDWVFNGTWSWNDDGSVSVDGSVCLMSVCDKLPFKFKTVTGSFNCNDTGLETLENCPDEVGTVFYCSRNNLKNLDFAPKKVGRDFFCTGYEGRFTVEEIKKICKTKRIFLR